MMSIKKKLIMGVASATLGLSLVGGGTYAYFSDTAATSNTFAAGTLDLTVDPTTIVNIENMKPGDYMYREFELGNSGSLDIKEILLQTSYTVNDTKSDNTEDLANHIKVNFLWNHDKTNGVIYSTSLAELATMSPDAVAESIFYPWFGEESGLPAGTVDNLSVEFEFVDNESDQNQFQGDTLQLEWAFEGKQGNGEELY